MISRRNIRVKVMQTIYTLSSQEAQQIKPGEPVKLLQKHFDHSKDLLFYLVYFLTEVAGYAEKDAHLRGARHLPSLADLHVNTKIAGNELLWKIKEEPSFQTELKRARPELKSDKELVRKLYQLLHETLQYKEYISTGERKPKIEKEILEFVINDLMLTDAGFLSHLEELFMNWEDDGDMVLQLMQNLLLKPSSVKFNEVMSPDKWNFAKNLLETVLEKTKHLETLIFPKLKNWDSERIALLDMIIMKMGVAEFLYFETIPPKVTINEYIDIAKEYSTQQSGQFVNGILDNIHKELIQEGKLHKIDFKKA
ncbi:MAG: transcription antitermination factor NusB [Flavisolibacter sp.]